MAIGSPVSYNTSDDTLIKKLIFIGILCIANRESESAAGLNFQNTQQVY